MCMLFSSSIQNGDNKSVISRQDALGLYSLYLALVRVICIPTMLELIMVRRKLIYQLFNYRRRIEMKDTL